jgi:hypothetical protein
MAETLPGFWPFEVRPPKILSIVPSMATADVLVALESEDADMWIGGPDAVICVVNEVIVRR